MKWTRAYKDRLPDSAFLIVSAGGRKDKSGRTVPRTLRHLPVRDIKGNVSVRHVRNALARIAHTDITAAQKKLARAKAEKLLRSSQKFASKQPPAVKRRRKKSAKRSEGPTRYDLGFTGRRYKSYGDAEPIKRTSLKAAKKHTADHMAGRVRRR